MRPAGVGSIAQEVGRRLGAGALLQPGCRRRGSARSTGGWSRPSWTCSRSARARRRSAPRTRPGAVDAEGWRDLMEPARRPPRRLVERRRRRDHPGRPGRGPVDGEGSDPDPAGPLAVRPLPSAARRALTPTGSRVSRSPTLPPGRPASRRTQPGFHHLDVRFEVGSRPGVAFEHAVETLMTWRMHTRAGLRVAASVAARRRGCRGPRPARPAAGPLPGGLGPRRARPDGASATARCPATPSPGRRPSWSVSPTGPSRSDVLAYSRPGLPVARLAGPLGRWGQRLVVRRYARALRCPH